jgi:predicted RecB family nuclease
VGGSSTHAEAEITLMLISEDIFQAFLRCETKSYLKFLGSTGDQREFTDWERNLGEDYKQQCCIQLRSNFREDECCVGTLLPQALENNIYRLVIDCAVHAQESQSHIHAIEQLTSPGKTKHHTYIPMRFVPSEKITKHDKLLLAFDALVFSTAFGKAPLFGKIIHGHEQATVKVDLAGLMDMAKTIVGKIAAQQTSQTPPPLVLNKHCAECEFKAQCRQVAIEKDDLSLLSSMTEKERKQQHTKGIFSVTQLSYTFRARRKPKRLASKPDKYSHALRALALREGKIHIAGRPELNMHGNPVYLDVEGVPDRDFYYLIGLRLKSGDAYVQYSFWANELSEEKEIWASLLQALAKIENPQLIHYGSYETTFLKRMKERYREAVENPAFLDQLIAESVNVLSVIYAQIYFPIYSNGLKEIAHYLGFQWSESDASGLHTLMWRSKWESSRDSCLKQKLVTYNAEDCEALERVASTVTQLCQRQTEAVASRDNSIVHTDSMKRENPYRFGKNEFSMPELEYINQAAYWDYQRDKIYVRSSQRLKRIYRKSVKGRAKALPVNKVIECPPPGCCPICKATKIRKQERKSKIVYDLRFGKAGIKRWIVKYLFHCCFYCSQCGAQFNSQQKPSTRSKYGSDLRSYMIYQIIELHLPQRPVAQSLNQLFGFNLPHDVVTHAKTRASQLYKGTYEGILKKIVNGRLAHADETKISIEGKNAFVWSLTNLEEAAYFYTESREGDFLQALLKEFKGVLVSDFYATYDSINCPQQKCLIHLMRDLNNSLLKEPFNEELRGLVREFAILLKPMIETVDRFGLKAHFLRKHKVLVEYFYKELSKRDYKSEIAVHYKKRFEKNRDKLFTFLDYDGIPWNNNNAEHAIKAFATLRKVIGGSSSDKGIHEYLTLFSICETCKFKGVSFLEFLRSGEKDIDVFIKKGARVSKGVGFESLLPE